MSVASVVDVARSWVGTPFLHQGRSRAGVDCVGLLVVVAQDLGLPIHDFTRYGRVPHPRRMGEELARQMDRISIGQAGPGDVFWLAWRDVPQHLAILTDGGMIHSFQTAGQVIEHPIDQTWRARVRGAFRFRLT